MSSIVRPWLAELPWKEQAVVLCALRGCDAVAKEHPSKLLVRHLRSVILHNADRATHYMILCPPSLDTVRTLFAWGLSDCPMYFVMHLLHAVEVVGYRHPDRRVRTYFAQVYEIGCQALHLRRESLDEMEARLASQEAA
jgi:hypothetical protein